MSLTPTELDDSFSFGLNVGISDSLDEKMIALTRYGEPRVVMCSGGWVAIIDMTVSSDGVNFSIKSDFRMKSPSSAVDQLISRLRSTIEALNK